jgi:dihydroorotase
VKILIKNGRVVDPSQNVDEQLDVLVEDGKVARVESGLSADAAETIDARGLVVSPGFVDMHVHLREPGREDEETVESGARAAIRGGFTSIACMPNTEPVVEGDEGVKFILSKAREAGFARVFPVAALSRNLEGEVLSEIGAAVGAGAVAVSDDGKPVMKSSLMRHALEYVKMFNTPVISHCEDLGLSGAGSMNEGKVSTLLGLKGIPPESEEVMVARDIILAELTASRLHIAHVSTRRSLELVADSKARGANVTCEVTPHHFTMSDESAKGYDTNTKMKPPLRSTGDVAAMRNGLKRGAIDAIASDHAPHSEEEKDQEYDLAPFGIIGLETSFGIACSQLYHEKVVPLAGLVALMSTGPARILGIPYGTLRQSSPADITMFDPDAAWTVDEKEFASKSRNTPFSGWKVKGRVVSVIVDGNVLMRDGALTSTEPESGKGL